MIQEILFSFMISILGADGENIDINIVLLDGSPYYKCLSDVGCSRIYDNHIFLDVNEFKRKDSCGNNPLIHELIHFKYSNEETHDRCYLNVQIVR